MVLEYKNEVHFIMVETMAVIKRWSATHRYIYKHILWSITWYVMEYYIEGDLLI